MRFDEDTSRRERSRSRAQKSRRHDRDFDADELMAVSRTRRHWYDETTLDAEDPGYEWMPSNARANLARRRLERYLDHMKLKDALEDVLTGEFDEDWTPPRNGRKRRRAKRSTRADV